VTVKLCTVTYITAYYTYIRVNIRIITDPRNAYCIVLTLYYYTYYSYKRLDIEAILSPTTNDGYEHQHVLSWVSLFVPPCVDTQHRSYTNRSTDTRPAWIT